MFVQVTVRACMTVVRGDMDVELEELPVGTLLVCGGEMFFRHYDDSYEADIDADPVWTSTDGVLYKGSDLQGLLSGREVPPLMIRLLP